MKKFLQTYILYIAWIQTILATIGSLYFSEIAKFPPCVLCWYQRICLYPLAILLPIGIWRKNKDLHLYVLPLSITGLIIATYQNLLYYDIIPESTAPCIQGISCTTKFIQWFGFVTIPLLSFTAFATITICMLIFWKVNKK